jgi:hypothetical protein
MTNSTRFCGCHLRVINHDRDPNSGLAEIYLHFVMPMLMLMARSRYAYPLQQLPVVLVVRQNALSLRARSMGSAACVRACVCAPLRRMVVSRPGRRRRRRR